MHFLHGYALGDEESVAHDILFEQYLEIHVGQERHQLSKIKSQSLGGVHPASYKPWTESTKIHPAFQDV